MGLVINQATGCSRKTDLIISLRNDSFTSTTNTICFPSSRIHHQRDGSSTTIHRSTNILIAMFVNCSKLRTRPERGRGSGEIKVLESLLILIYLRILVVGCNKLNDSLVNK